jgi:hypothetical protein
LNRLFENSFCFLIFQGLSLHSQQRGLQQSVLCHGGWTLAVEPQQVLGSDVQRAKE